MGKVCTTQKLSLVFVTRTCDMTQVHSCRVLRSYQATKLPSYLPTYLSTAQLALCTLPLWCSWADSSTSHCMCQRLELLPRPTVSQYGWLRLRTVETDAAFVLVSIDKDGVCLRPINELSSLRVSSDGGIDSIIYGNCVLHIVGKEVREFVLSPATLVEMRFRFTQNCMFLKIFK